MPPTISKPTELSNCRSVRASGTPPPAPGGRRVQWRGRAPEAAIGHPGLAWARVVDSAGYVVVRCFHERVGPHCGGADAIHPNGFDKRAQPPDAVEPFPEH